MEKIFTPWALEKAIKTCPLLVLLLCFCPSLRAQEVKSADSLTHFPNLVQAGAEYERSGLHEWLWGKDYRREWAASVRFPVLNLDTAFGGLTPLKEGGGRQTRSLHLVSRDGRRFVLRSVNKTYLGAIPETVKGTFVENLANDQIATNHPYAALTVPMMADAAGIYHTNPRYYIVPHSQRLGKYNAIFAHTLCLLEERPDETQKDMANFGHADNIVSTETMLENLLAQNDHVMDQHAYMKTRLFDMFIGDWGRHEDNWRWAIFDSGTYKIYRPVPKDRDQTYAKFEGKLLGLIIRLGKFKELQSFDEDIKNVKWYNYPAYSLDKRLTNELTRQVWLDSARALQQYLTDDVIEQAVKEMPAEIAALSGEEIIRKLKARRDHLQEYAQEYFSFLAKDVEVPGSKQRELFEIKRVNDQETSLMIYRLSKEGKVQEETPFFSRTFLHDQTHEIGVYGVGGEDIFRVTGTVKKGIKIRVIGGPDKDSLLDISSVEGWGKKTKYYDNPGNSVVTANETNRHISKFLSTNRYSYDIFRYDTRGVKPAFYYNTYYRFYVGLGYAFVKNRTRAGSFTAKHSIGVNYSLIEKSFHPYYRGTYRELIGRWNLNLSAGYDQVRRFNYFGLGNQTKIYTEDVSYYWLRMKTIYGAFGIDQSFLGRHNLRLDFQYNAVKVLDQDGRYTSKRVGVIDASNFEWKQFGAAQLTYTYLKTDSRILPTKGISFQMAGSYTQNLRRKEGNIRNGQSSLNLYLPLFKPFSIAIKSGGAYLAGNPEFYQYNSIGGFYSLRGYWRYRFYGKAMFYNQNELRWLPTVKGRFYSGKLGLLAFYDQGRVWQPGENSDKWHYGYGGGFVIAPFDRIVIAATYGISEEGNRINLRLGKLL